MEIYGKIFKKFRQARGLKLKDIATSNLSVSQLSKFENGETDLTISKFSVALCGLNMFIDEFMYAANDFHRDEVSELLDEIKIKTVKKDGNALKRLLIHYSEQQLQDKNNFTKINIVLLRLRLRHLTGDKKIEQDVKYLTDYLFSVDFWGRYELLLFMNTIDVLNHETYMVLAREMVRRTDFYKDIPSNRKLISRMLLNGYISSINEGEFFDALYFEKQLNNCFFDDTELYERFVFQYSKSLYDYKKIQIR